MAQRLHAAAAAADERPFPGAPLVDMRRRNAVQTHREAERLRAQHVVHVGHGVHAQPPGLGGQPPHSRQGVMGAFYIDVEKPDI